MNLVEISEMLKGAPDTYLTQHIQSPDGSVPQYLALAELQRRQDMRARFAQQTPQTTVADDATQGIAAAAPEMMPPAPPMAPPGAGFAEGGEVADKSAMKDTVLDQILRRLGIRNLPSEKVAYEGGIRQAQRRLAGTVSNTDQRMQQHARRMQQGMQLQEDKVREQARKSMLDNPLDAIQAERERYNLASPAERMAMDKAQQEAFEKEQNDWLRQRMIDYPEEFKLGPGPSTKTSGLPPPGYKEGGLVEQYINNAGRFESGNNRNAKNPFSSASGRFQFINSTRRRLDKKYGFDPKDRSDETERARMEAYTNETIQALESANIPVTGGTLYGGHFLGQGGIKKFFEAYRKDPTTNVSEHFSAEIIRKNPAIFNPRGGKARTTLAEVMEKFDKVGGGRQRTPMTDEDMNMGAAIQVANRADRGDIGPYEDMNLAQASALAQLLEKSKLGQGPMVGYTKTQREPDPSFFYNPVDAQIKAKLLERYTNPGIAGGVPGFNQGGMVKGYSGADGVSLVAPQSKMDIMAAKRLAEANAARAKRNLPPLKSASEISLADESYMHEADRAAYAESAENISKRPFLYDSNAARAVEGVLGAVGRVPSYIGALGSGLARDVTALAGLAFDPRNSAEFQAKHTPGAKPPSQFFYTPESAANTGGSGILGGAGIELPPTAPSTQPTAEEVAAAGQRMREGAAPSAPSAPSVPAATPPVSRADTFAEQFLQELRDAKMSKEEMRQTALLQAGLGMMTGTSPNFLANVGQGAMAGLQAYQQAKAQNQALASEAYKNMMAARALGLEEEKVGISRTEADALKKYREDTIRLQRDELAAKSEIAALKAQNGEKGITQKDVFEAINRRFADMSKERDSNVLSYRDPSDPSKPMTDAMLRNMARQHIQNALYDANIVIGGGAGVTTVEVPSG